MNRNKIFEVVYEQIEGRVLGGMLDHQDEAQEWISTFLASVKTYQKLLDIDWIVVIPSSNSTAQQKHFFGERKPWFITMNGEKKGKNEFIETFAHELAHVYYEDDGIVPSQIKNPVHWEAIIELRADLKMEEWGALRFKKDTYLYGGGWEQFAKSISKDEALSFAKIGNTAEIITQYAHQYP